MDRRCIIENFPEICRKWLETKQETVTANTFINYKGILENYAIPFFKERDYELSSELLREYRNYLKERSITDHTIMMHFQLLKVILIPEAPLAASMFYELNDELFGKEKKKSKKQLKTNDLKKLEKHLRDDPDGKKLCVYLKCKLKMTSGMLCALKWSDIDIEKRKIYVTRVVMRENLVKYSPGQPKTAVVERDYRYHNGKKVFNIPQNLVDVIEEIMPEYRELYVFTSTQTCGEPKNYSNYTSRCYAECNIDLKQ